MKTIGGYYIQCILESSVTLKANSLCFLVFHAININVRIHAIHAVPFPLVETTLRVSHLFPAFYMKPIFRKL